MKKKIIYITLILTTFLSIFQISNASTNTLTRPSDTLGITKNIEITSARKNAALKTPYVDANEKIYDFADLFTSNEETQLYNSVKEFIQKYKTDMVIVTINENPKSSSMAYADDFYDYNDFGITNKYTGILFLIDMDKRKMWISTTGSAINELSSSDIDSILDKCYTHISNEQYFECAQKFITETSHTYSSNKIWGWIIGFIFAIIISLAIPTIFCLIKKSKHKAIKLAINADTYAETSSFNMLNEKDTFIRTHTSRTERASSSSSGGSSHSGSSGISHGGGGRSF